MDTTSLIFCTGLGLIYLAFCLFRKKRHPLYPPGPPSLPILGNMLQLGKEPQKVFLKWCEKYGDVFSFKIGSAETIMLNDAKIIKEVFSKSSSTGRSPNPVFQELCQKDCGIANNEGPIWEEQRRFTMKTLKDLGFARTSMEGKLLEEINGMIQYFNNRLDKPIPGHRIFNGAVVNTIWSIVADERTEWDCPEPPEIFKLTMTFTESLNRTVSSGVMFAPFLRHIAPGFFGWTEWVKSNTDLNKYMKRTIARHKEKLDINKPMDFIDYYLVEIYNTTDPNSSFYKDSGEKHLEATIVELFLGGSETTSHTMSWAIAYLAYYPKVQQKVQAEIDNVIGQCRKPSPTDRYSLPYTEATLLEVLRITAMAGNGLPHKMMEDAIIGGYFFPKDCTVISNLYKVHHNPKTWGDPENFRPERFLSEDGTKVVCRENLLPFSCGKRVCPGEHLAKDALLLFVASIMQTFEIKPAPESNLEQVKNTSPTNQIVHEPEPFYIVVSKRNVN